MIRNTASGLLTAGLSSKIRGEEMSNVRERGWTVAGNLGLDSMAVNLAFMGAGAISNLTGGHLSKALTAAGMVYASQGGKMTKGMLLWKEGNGLDKFTFPMNPASLKETLNPVWAETIVPGQPRPMYQFINGGPRELSFTLNFFYQDRKRDVIRDQIDALKSLTQRRNNHTLRGTYEGPPPVQFYFGDYFDGERFIVKSLDIESYDLFDPRTLLPLRADVQIVLSEVLDTFDPHQDGKDAHGVKVGIAGGENTLKIPGIKV